MYRKPLIIVISQVAGCLCTAEYEQFPGFGETSTVARDTSTAEVDDLYNASSVLSISALDMDSTEIKPSKSPKYDRLSSAAMPTFTTTTTTTSAVGLVTNLTTTRPATKLIVDNYTTLTTTDRVTARFYGARKKMKYYVEKGNATTHPPTDSTISLCPEEDKPSNIGPYEVPTQLDLVSVIKATLRRTFRRYHKKALLFLSDMKKATRATSLEATNCANPATYRRCVHRVGSQCETIATSYLTFMETMRRDVDALTEGTICNLSSMRGDPVTLIKLLAMEEASLDFALPGFLRLLSACSVYCSTGNTMTKVLGQFIRATEDPVIKQFLTPKHYTPMRNQGIGNNHVSVFDV